MKQPHPRAIYRPFVAANPDASPSDHATTPNSLTAYLEMPETQELIVRAMCQRLGLDHTIDARAL